jgi:hypothetical protein
VLYAARKAEAITIAKERTILGSWVWALSSTRERTREDVGLPGP